MIGLGTDARHPSAVNIFVAIRLETRSATSNDYSVGTVWASIGRNYHCLTWYVAVSPELMRTIIHTASTHRGTFLTWGHCN